MKKLYIVLLFVISVLITFFVTKSISGDSNPVPDYLDTIPDTTGTIVINYDSVDTPIVPLSPNPVPDSPKVVKPKPPIPIPDPDSLKAKKHVKISTAEVKNLIMTGKYTRDKRISKEYSIDYVDVSDDDLNSGLQQNLQYVQDRVAYGEDGDGWRGFEVVDLDYDSKGLVNRIVIRPVY